MNQKKTRESTDIGNMRGNGREQTVSTRSLPGYELLRAHWQRFRLAFPFHTSPRRIALGVSIGLFVAFLPTIGFQMGLAFVIAWVLRASRPAAIACVWVTNPWNLGMVYAFTYMVGRPFWFTQPDVSYTELCQVIESNHAVPGAFVVFGAFQNMFSLGEGLFVPMLIGGITIGLIVGLFSYYPSMAIAVYCQRTLGRHKHGRRRTHHRASATVRVQTTSTRHRSNVRPTRREAA